jgi:Tfp pilus assembly protein PilX
MNFLSPIYNLRHRTRGYTLLFAVLIAALVLGVAVFILDISTKQYALSASARDSMYSFYAADSGIECTAYNSGSGVVGTVNVYDTSYNSSNHQNQIICGSGNGNPVNFYYNTLSSYQYQTNPVLFASNASSTTFSLQLTSPTCAVITIIEYYDAAGYYHDLTQSRGYNHCVNNGSANAPNWGPDTTNPSTVERALQLSHSLSGS